ncbi:PRC-barrel domain-containing protein [Roseivivax isoporae]|uniref:PRC-barrel domain-containing protein n=1 Tax=Roseivivax isoporae LMG 25204 TaxID=1449351 RepID=X7F3G2_9RHOB|nr:PRC-barrel domain-containing protein [Roseivivax isoporae]ETX27288.1 hypothetical protein RISW2_14910 [Roseivivax isoporae LMG 25204]
MLISLADLLTFRIRAGEARHPVGDLLFDGATMAPAYLSVDIGGWLERECLLVAAARMRDVDPAGGEVILDTREDELRDAPRWRDDQPLGDFLAAMPPLVVGPFGATHAPLAMAAELSPQRSPDDAGGDARALELLERFESASDWIGSEVFGADGALGTLASLVLDTGQNRLTHLVIDNEKVLAGKLLAVPASILRHRAKGGHLVLDVTRAALNAAPQMRDLGDLDQRGTTALHAHFVPPM